MDHPLRRRVQAGDDPRFGHAPRSVPGRVAGSSGSGLRSPRCWPPPPCRSCSTTPSPSTAGTCSRRWRGSTPISFSLSLAVLFLGLFACAIREGRYRGWAAIVLAGCVLSHIVPGMYALGGAVILTIVELLPARWGIGDSALHVWRSDPARRSPCLGRAPCGGPARPWRSGCCSRGGGWSPSGWSTRTRRRWATRTSRVGPSTSERPTPGLSCWPASAPSPRVVVRSRFGITVTVLGIASAVATAVDPQGSLYNVRLLPLWFLSVYFMAAWAFGTVCIAVATAWRRARDRRWAGRRPKRPRGRRGPPPHRPWEEPRTAGEPASGGQPPPDPPRAGAVPALGPGRRQRCRPRAARRHGGRRAALHPSGVVAAGHRRAQRGHELVQLQLRGLRGPGVVPGVQVGHADHGRGRQALRLRPGDVGVQRE